MCLWIGFTSDLCLPYLYFFLFFCVCGSIMSMFYTSFNLLFSFASVACLHQCSMPLYLYFFTFLLWRWLGFANVLCLFIIVFFFYARVFVLPMFYASLYIDFYFCICESVLSMFYANKFVVFFSFLLCLWLSLAIFLCRFFHVLLFLCVCVLVLPMLYDSLNVWDFLSFYLFFCKDGFVFPIFYAPLNVFFSFILRMWLDLANVLCLFMCIFFFSFLLCLCLCFVNAL